MAYHISGRVAHRPSTVPELRVTLGARRGCARRGGVPAKPHATARGRRDRPTRRSPTALRARARVITPATDERGHRRPRHRVRCACPAGTASGFSPTSRSPLGPELADGRPDQALWRAHACHTPAAIPSSSTPVDPPTRRVPPRSQSRLSLRFSTCF
jgi:hypothetical protein